jgi:replicative DNA helicase
VLDIAAKVRGAKAAGPLGLVVVDYLQRVRPAADAHSREREVAAISDELSAIAKEFRVPLLVLAQLNREAEKTDNKLPTLGNLRESGTIEQDADVVMFVYRPGYYKRDPGNEGEATIAVAKNRNGDTGRADVRWIGNRMLFQNLETRHG